MDEVEATKLIPELPSSVVKRVTEGLEKRIRKGLVPTESYQGGKLYEFGDKGAGYLVLTDDDEVVYFVRHEQVRHNGLRLGRQVLVWRDKQKITGAGFAAFAFFEILLPKYKVLVADKEQTANGRSFWQYVFREALRNPRLHGYFLDRRSSPNRLIEIASWEDFKKYEPLMWGTSEGHKRTFAVVSTTKLKLKPKG